ncbi:type II secretion system F family protein [Candidatus Pacearchaeota archaeon]|nr:type II secretion system F family protein [Candidatus Pacearchaeota archaeon]
MEFKIPFAFSNIEILKKRSERFMRNTKRSHGKLENYLANSGKDIDKIQYLAICRRSFLLNFIFFSTLFTTFMFFIGGTYFYLQGLFFAVLITAFIYFNQINYPRIFSYNKAKAIEKNLIPALQDMLIQLNSGVPIYRILLNISQSKYGEVSEEFKKIANEINAGTSQIDAIEKSGKTNISEYFKRVLWQISNGMRAGSDMSIVIKESMKNLEDEQAIQIQNYGGSLNPLIMFYMLIAVIIPSLGITFLVIIFSMIGASQNIIYLVFGFIFGFVTLTQIMFLGVIKSRRPSLL